VVAVHTRNADFVCVEKLDYAADERGTQEWHIAARQVRRPDAPLQRRQTRRQALERSSAAFLIADNLDANGQGRDGLLRRRNDHHGRHHRTQQPMHAWKHQFAGDRQPRFRPAHPRTLAAAQDNSTD
jgi:hypothetical protein